MMMLGRMFVALLLVTSLASTSRAATGAEAKAAEPLPKPAPRGDGQPAELAKMPPFLGVFGSAELIAKHGFHSKVGSFVEYRLNAKDKQSLPGDQYLRIAEVGPEVPGARWIEITVNAEGMAAGQGMRILTRGEKDGNLERFIIHVAGMPPMEMPLEAVGSGFGSASISMGNELIGPYKVLGKETVKTPVGTFATEHYLFTGENNDGRMELWVTHDERVPFVGIVKMLTAKGLAVVSKVGTDAQAVIPVPSR